MATKVEIGQYDVSCSPRGYCVIFNNTYFTKTYLPTRYGSDRDAKALENLFHVLLGFQVMVYNNTSEVEMMLHLCELAQMDHCCFSAFFVFILSHGDRGVILTSDCKAVQINSLAEHFTIKNCKSLAKKPKVFVIQACQGDKIAELVTIPSEYLIESVPALEQDGNSNFELTASNATTDEADFLFAFATVSGKAAMRDANKGTWYIQALITALEEHANNRHFVEILTSVTDELSSYNHQNRTQVCTYQSTLRKRLFLPLVKLRRSVSVPVRDNPTPKPKRRHMSESHQNYVISSNLGSLNSFENISGKESPCLVLKECQSTENEDFETLYSCTKPHNNSNLISTAMNLIEKCSDNVSSNISLTTSPLESDSPDQVRSKLDHKQESVSSGSQCSARSNESLPYNTIAYKMTARTFGYPCGYLVLVDNIGSEKTQQVTEEVARLFRTCIRMHVQTYLNLSRKAMKQLFNALSQSDHGLLNCLVVIVLSHGKRVKGVYDTHRKLITPESICSYFSDINCETLKMKPKLFLFETVVDTSDVILNCDPIHYPCIDNCFVVSNTIMNSTHGVSCILKFTKALCQKGNVIDVVCEMKLMHREFKVGQIIVDTNKLPSKPLLFNVVTDPSQTSFDEERVFVERCFELAFNLWLNVRSLTIQTLKNNIDEVVQVCNSARQVRIGFSTASVVGGIVAILGLTLIPVTVGGSVVISAAGGAVAAAGGVGSFGSTIIEKRLSHSKLKKVQQCINVDKQLCQLIASLHNKLTIIGSTEHSDEPSTKPGMSVLHLGKVVQSSAYITKGAIVGVEMGRSGGTLAVQGGVFAARIGSTALRSVAVAGAVVSIIILPWDIYELTSNAVKYHNRSESEASKWLNLQLEILEQGMKKAQEIIHSDSPKLIPA